MNVESEFYELSNEDVNDEDNEGFVIDNTPNDTRETLYIIEMSLENT